MFFYNAGCSRRSAVALMIWSLFPLLLSYSVPLFLLVVVVLETGFGHNFSSGMHLGSPLFDFVCRPSSNGPISPPIG